MAKRSKKKKHKRRGKKSSRKTKLIKKRKKISRKKLSKETKDIDGNLVFKVPEKWSSQAYVNKSQYEKKYNLSIKNNEDFSLRNAMKRLDYTKTVDYNIIRFAYELINQNIYGEKQFSFNEECTHEHILPKNILEKLPI